MGAAAFDKDDDLAVEIVTAASNLRAACYGIPAQSLFAAKGMAGNIIHAIATTNAIISGLIVTEACKILAGGATHWLAHHQRHLPPNTQHDHAAVIQCPTPQLTQACQHHACHKPAHDTTARMLTCHRPRSLHLQA